MDHTPHDDGPTSLSAARSAVRALTDGGVRHLLLSPGSRSAPLAYAAAEAEARGELRIHVRIDERDAGFTALGISLASGRPVAVATTSGTAVGELLPAVMEANHAGVPLVVLSADRPEELRGTGANQTTDQTGLFGRHVRFAADVPAGQDPAAPVRRALLAADGIAGAEEDAGAFGALSLHAVPRGPVHLNLAFRDPLVPDPLDALPGTGEAGTPGTSTPAEPPEQRRPEPASGEPGWPGAGEPGWPSAGDLPQRRTVVVAGHGAGPEAERFARDHGLPLLAEPTSNARFGPVAIGPYRLLLGPFGPAIERVVVFGRPTLSRPVARLLASRGVAAALYVPEPVAWFEPGRRNERIIEDPADLSLFAGRGADGWLEAWTDAAGAAERAIAGVLDSERGVTGPGLAAAVWEASTGNLVLGSSNAVRDADLAAVPDPGTPTHGSRGSGLDGTDAGSASGRRVVFANRGLAGIDGTLATAAGIALGSGRRTTVLLGDVTFLHDVGGLLLGTGEPEPELDIVVLNDEGGAIFSTLEHGAVAESGRYGTTVERLFGTPHAVRIEALAAAYGLDYVRAAEPETVRAVLDAGARRRRRIVDVTIDRRDVRGLHRRIAAAVAEAVGRPAAAWETAGV